MYKDEIRKEILEFIKTLKANDVMSSHIDEIDLDDFFENLEMDWDSFVEAVRKYGYEVPSYDYKHLLEIIYPTKFNKENTTDFNSDSDKLQNTTTLTD